ncbi:hypothetical protein GCM10027614_18550 [Micromonospora vulcania]
MAARTAIVRAARAVRCLGWARGRDGNPEPGASRHALVLRESRDAVVLVENLHGGARGDHVRPEAGHGDVRGEPLRASRVRVDGLLDRGEVDVRVP